MVGAVVPERHLHGRSAAGECQELVTEADSEEGQTGVQKTANGLDGVRARLRVARPVGQEDTVRQKRKNDLSGRLGGHDGDPATAVGEHAQNVALDAEVVSHDVARAGRALRLRVAAPERPGASTPGTLVSARDDLGQVHARQARERLRASQGFVGASVRACRDAARLCAFFANQPRQPPRVQISDCDGATRGEVLGQGLLVPPTRMRRGAVPDHESGGPDTRRLDIFGIDARVADVRIGQRDDLPRIGRVGEDLLVAGHGGVEHDLADREPGCTNGPATEDRSIFQH